MGRAGRVQETVVLVDGARCATSVLQQNGSTSKGLYKIQAISFNNASNNQGAKKGIFTKGVAIILLLSVQEWE